MLQKPENIGYNRLSRRQVLQILGVGMGALAVGGCTSKVLEHGLSSSNQLEPLAASTSSLFWRTTQASKNLDKEYLRERSKRLKRIVKQLKQGQGNPKELANEVRQVGYEIIGHGAERRVLQALDADLVEILTTTPRSLVLPLPEMKIIVKQLQLELGISDNDIQGWEEAYQWDKGKLLEAISKEGSEMLWRQWLVASSTELATPARSAPMQGPVFPPPPPWLPWPLKVLWVATCLLIAWGQSTGPHADCVPSPCPGIPPVPPPPPVPCNIPGCGGCFVQGTLIATTRGPKPIQAIQPGDSIYAFDINAGDVVEQKVIETFKSQSEEILVLDFGTEELCCTPLHRFYTEQWIHAKDLGCGDRVLSLNGQWKKLRAMKREVKPQPVFNLYVAEVHNYFVGQTGLLVHNSKTPDAVKIE